MWRNSNMLRHSNNSNWLPVSLSVNKNTKKKNILTLNSGKLISMFVYNPRIIMRIRKNSNDNI